MAATLLSPPPPIKRETRVYDHLSINNEDVEALCFEIFNAKSKSILIKKIYLQPAGAYNEFET